MVSKYYEGFLRKVLSNYGSTDICIDIVKNVFELSTHLVRVRSVARAAGFCAFYGRMAEKMGVYEVLEGSSVVRGREVHRILGLASLNLFIDNPSPDADLSKGIKRVEELVERYVTVASEELKNVFDVKSESIGVAKKLLNRLIIALPKAKQLLGLDLNDPLFPVVEQQFADYKTRMFGAPDLVLENKEKGKVIVVEWKTYTPEYESRSSSASDLEKAQVVAYSIIEARRLGINSLKDIFESISGIELKTVKELTKKIEEQSKSDGKHSRFSATAIGLDTLRSKGLLKVLPIIVTPSGGYPPHPFMYKDHNIMKMYERFVKLYKIFKGVIVAAEHLALQIMNIPDLLSATSSYTADYIRTVCTTKEGYQVYSLTPFEYLKRGKRSWDDYPCRLCGFRGVDGPCEFYFGVRRPSDYFDKLMWWARHRVYSRRERDLISHRAMYEIFRNTALRVSIFSSGNPFGIEVDLSQLPQLRTRIRRGLVLYSVRVKRGSQSLGKFRFDYFKISDVEFDRDNNFIELRRELRAIESQKQVVGFLRRSVYLSILEPGRSVNPLLSINTFVMIDEVFVSEDDKKVIYKCYSPSPVLMHNFMIFGKYIEIYKKRSPNAYVLAYETPVDLTIMELRAIDALHRYLKTVASNPDKILEELKRYGVEGIEKNDLIAESELLNKHIPKDEDVLGVSTLHLYNLLRKKVIMAGDSGG